MEPMDLPGSSCGMYYASYGVRHKRREKLDFKLENCIGFVTDSAMKRISEDFNRRLEKQGSTRKQWVAMYFLERAKQPISQKELAQLMNIKDSTLARLVDRMERDHLLIRIESKADKRVKYLELTEEGKFKLDKLMPVGENFNDLLMEGLTEEDLVVFQKVIDRMLANTAK